MTRLAPQTVEDLVVALLRLYGANAATAHAVAANLVWNALVGRDNFTFGRLPIFLERMQKGVLNGQADPEAVKLGPAVARLDGQAGFGHVAGNRGMQCALELAREAGAGVCGVHNSNFFGTGACFVNMAAEHGMIGLALSNSYPKVAAHHGYLPVLGTNPMAFGAPRANGEHFLLDMATSALAGSTVRQHIAEGRDLPEGLAVAADGQPITDPSRVSEGALLPFGGAKGFGLSLMVEILAGVLTGAGVSKGVASLYSDFSQSGHSGHFLVAIDVSRFMPIAHYFERLEGLLEMVRSSDPEGGVRYPGEIRWQAFARNKAEGLLLTPRDRELLAEWAAPVGLQLPFEEQV